MRKVFCDKCGEEIRGESQDGKYNVNVYGEDLFPQKIDLCDNCQKAFEEWMDKFLENEEVGE
jgi:hypothetical protein